MRSTHDYQVSLICYGSPHIQRCRGRVKNFAYAARFHSPFYCFLAPSPYYDRGITEELYRFLLKAHLSCGIAGKAASHLCQPFSLESTTRGWFFVSRTCVEGSLKLQEKLMQWLPKQPTFNAGREASGQIHFGRSNFFRGSIYSSPSLRVVSDETR